MIIVAIILVLFLLIVAPWLAIVAINQVFSMQIPFTLNTWFFMLVLIAIFAAPKNR